LISLGIVIMVCGAGVASVPLSTVTVGPVSITGISPFSAALLFVGAVILAFGITVYLKGR
jgi:hypothetical protein